ncbi:MAG: ribonuclease Z [Candidatus Nitrosocaldaceae archaeon]|nr:MAG: ribonuclease Z [Candidatus Nitrosocaldaceae archaeon]
MQMRIFFLGTSSAVPTAKRGLSSIAITRGDEVLIFDTGEGMQRNFLQSGIGTNKKMSIFISHMHSDHVTGLLGLLQTLSLFRRSKEVRIYGPNELLEFVAVNQRLLNFNITYPLRFKEVEEGIVHKSKGYKIKAILAEHNIKAFSYTLEEDPRPGIFYPDKAIALGVPKGTLWHKLQHGEAVTIDDKIIKPEDVTGPKRKGRKIGISGDTRPNERLIEFFKDADVLIFDSTYGDDHAKNALENMHSTAREAAFVANKANVKLLVLTHFSARYEDTSVLVEEAKKVHDNVIAAEDMLVLDVPYS